MTNRRLRRLTAIVASALLAVAFSASRSHAAATSTEDALARAEFDKELTLDIKNAPVVGAFRLLSMETSVPFVVDFEDDPGLRVTFRAQNMVARGVLASVASAYGLETDGGRCVQHDIGPIQISGYGFGGNLKRKRYHAFKHLERVLETNGRMRTNLYGDSLAHIDHLGSQCLLQIDQCVNVFNLTCSQCNEQP